MKKTTFTILSQAPIIGQLGFDRLYAGCQTSGIIKLVFVFFMLAFNFVPQSFFVLGGTIALILNIIGAIWIFTDYVRSVFNCLSRSQYLAYCNHNIKQGWNGPKDIHRSFWLSILFLVLNIASAVLLFFMMILAPLP